MLPSYQLRYSSRRKTLQLKIKDGQLFVSAPSALPLLQIERFIKDKEGWISKHLASSAKEKPNWLSRNVLPYLGEELVLKRVAGASNSYVFEHQTLWLQLSARTKPDNRLAWQQKLIILFYKEETTRWFSEQAKDYAAKMNVSYQRIESGDFKRKWGSCTSFGVLHFNWRLMMAPQWVCHYLLVHELAHLRHMNHGKEFWRLVALHNSDAKRAKEWLRENQHWMTLEGA